MRNVTPEQMTVIINIQMMREKIYPRYDKHDDFEDLSQQTIEELRELQENLIPIYNQKIQS